MAQKPKIILVGELPSSNWCKPFGLLDQLHKDGVVECYRVTPHQKIPAGWIAANAIICRPSCSGHLAISNVEKPEEPMVIATLSKGVDHICLPKTYVKKIISATGDANARAVADHTITLASQLLRPADQASAEMLQQAWGIRIDSESHQFDNFEWGCIGSGSQVKFLLPHLIAYRCPIIRVFHPEMDNTRLLNTICPNQTFKIEKEMELTISNPTGRRTRIIGTYNDDDIFLSSDIISLHVPVVKSQESRYKYSTYELISKKTIAKMKRGVFLINPARGALVNEGDVMNALYNGLIGGIGSDVVSPEAEATKDPGHSPLWQGACNLEKEKESGQLRKFRIYLTPHIGGSTNEAMNIIASDVIPRLIQSLCIPEKCYRNLL